MANDPLSPFDEDVLSTVAAATEVPIDELRQTVADHQQTMRDTPGIEDLVYEWRKQYDDPVLLREPSVFILAVPPTVWEEYGAYLDIEDDLLSALTAVHQEQTVRHEELSLDGMTEGHTAIVVGRTK